MADSLHPDDDVGAWAGQAEAERRRVAELLERDLLGPLGLLLAQAHAYEQSLGEHPPARLALAVLGSLARQALQQARDLADSLRPAVLDELGLEPALDALASQLRRAHGLQVALFAVRLRDRPPRAVELALFRLAQDAAERAAAARARLLTIRLERQGERLVLALADDGAPDMSLDALLPARRRLIQLGGTVELGASPHGGLLLVARMAVASPPGLTPRELAVLRLLARGMSNKAIAAELGLSARTVNFHLDNLYSKLGVASRTEALLAALRLGLVQAAGDPG